MRARSIFFLFLALFIVPAAMAQLTRGNVVMWTTKAMPMVADVNGDGLDDLIGADDVALNLGNGTFAARRTVVPAGTELIWTSLDFNGDGMADLIAGETAPSLPPMLPSQAPSGPAFHLYRSTGGGNFTSVGVLPMAGWPYAVDFNGDGKDDLVMLANAFDDPIVHASFYRSNGDGTFTLADQKEFPRGWGMSAPQSGIGYRLAVGDLNRDGLADLVLRGANSLVFFFGRADGAFDQVTRYFPDAAGGQALDIVDVDGDGNPDVIFTSGINTIRVMFGDGTGRFPRAASYDIPERHFGDGDGNYAVGKFTGAQPEVAVATDAGTLIILTVEGGQFKEKTRLSVGLHMPAKVFGGRFFTPINRDLLFSGFSNGDRLGEYETVPVVGAHADTQPVRSAPRRTRAVGPRLGTPSRTPAPGPITSFNISIDDDCTSYADRWSFTPEGFFLNDAAPKAGRLLEAAYLDGAYFFRLTPDATNPNVPLVTNGMFIDAGFGAASGVDSCGKQAAFRVNVSR